MSEDKVMEIMQIAREPASLETPIGEEDDSNLGDFVADGNVVTPEGNVESVMLREHIDALLGDLKERERQVIILRFGLEDGHPRTLEEVGKAFNVTRERIRQIEAKALRKLRNPVRANGFAISCKSCIILIKRGICLEFPERFNKKIKQFVPVRGYRLLFSSFEEYELLCISSYDV